MNNENILLKNALIHENGHQRRTEHILRVYSLCSCIASFENISHEDQIIIRAAAILHDIAIKTCKEKYSDACQHMQQKEALNIVPDMLKAADYPPSMTEDILFLIINHHNYNSISDIKLQILIEADLLINYMENPLETKNIAPLIFKTVVGKQLEASIIKNSSKDF